MTPLVLLHGFMGRGTDWDAVLAAEGLGREVYAPDLPGHGTSVGLEDEAYTMDGAAERVLEGAGGASERVDVVGYSMGGRLALHLAVTRPDVVRRLVLVSASPGLRTEAERVARRALDARRAAAIEHDLEAFLEDWYRTPLFSGLEDGARRTLTASRAHNDPTELGRSLRGMGTGEQPSHWPALAGISAPALAVAGALDTKYVRLAGDMAEHGLEVAVVPRAGHSVHTEAPDALALLLTSFLSDG